MPKKIVKVPEIPVLGTGKTDYVAIQRIAEQERDSDTDSIVTDRFDELEAPEATDTDRPPAPRVEN